MELKETYKAFQIKLLSEITECWCVWGKKQQRKIWWRRIYLINYNKENDVALFPENKFCYLHELALQSTDLQSPYAFHVGKWNCLWTVLKRDILTFSQINNLFLTCCLGTMVKRHSKATQLPFLSSAGARMKTLIEGTLGRWPFQESWKQFLFDQQTHIELKLVYGVF